MKNFKFILLSFSIIIGLVSHSQTVTLEYRFNNYVVIPGTTNDTLVFDLEIMSPTSGTYLVGFQSDVIFSIDAFGTNAWPVEINRLSLVSNVMVYNFETFQSNPTTNSFRHAITQFFPPYNPSVLSLVPTGTWGSLIQYKLLIMDNTFVAGIQLGLAAMTGNQFYVMTQTSTLSVYDPIVADNDLLTFSLYPKFYDLIISEIADPSNSSSGRFLEIYNGDTEDVNFLVWPCYLITEFAGGVSINVERLQGMIQSGETFVIAYDNDDFHSDYGFYPDQADNAIGLTGVDAVALYAFGDTTSGVLIDMYGEFGESGNSQPWYYEDRQAVRRFDIVTPNTVWTNSEWMIRGAEYIDMTPQSHRDTLIWTGGTSYDAWREKANWNPNYIPDAAHDVIINTMPGPIMQAGDTTACHDINF